jgi:hypothetical protein
MISFVDKEMMLSLEVPEDWKIGSSAEFLRLFLAPPQNDYQANLGMSVSQSNGAPPEAMDELLKQTDEQNKAEDPTYKQTKYEKLKIDGNQARLRRYDSTLDEPKLQLSQIQVLILKGPLLLAIDGSSLKKLEKDYLPIFEKMVKSIRFIQKPA